MCVASLYDLENGRGSKALATETLAVPFFIEDETGRILVDARGAEPQVESTPLEFSGNEPEAMRRFVGRHAGPNATAATATECCIKPGDRLFMLGSVRESPAHLRPALASGFAV